MRARHTVLVAVVGAALGVFAGLLWVHRIDERRPRVRIVSGPNAPRWMPKGTNAERHRPEKTSAARAVGKGAAAENPTGLDRQEASRNGGPRTPNNVGAPDSEEWPPLRSPLDLKVGGAGNLLLHESEYVIAGAARDLVVVTDETPGKRLSAQRRARAQASREQYEKILAASMEQRRRVGAAPWSSERFQVIAAVNARASWCFAEIGRDWDLPASPERSLRWYVESGNAHPDQGTRAEILTRLRAYEVRRRRLLSDVVAAVRRDRAEHPLRREQTADVVAYVITAGRLVLIRDSEIPELRGIVQKGGVLVADFLRDAEGRLK